MQNASKIWLTIAFIICSLIGFLVKLPRIFHHYDKELHALFYFFASIFLSLIFPKRSFSISSFLVIFGVFIEFAQEYSNKISMRMIGKAIHGRFDIQDVKYNLLGVVVGFSLYQIYNLALKSKS